MTTTLKLDFVSDVVCPWCIIGYKRLQQAIDELGVQDQIDITWQPFELNPDMPPEGENVTEHIVRKYGTSTAEAKSNADNITRLGSEMGFTFDFFDDMRIVNTRDAHMLLEYAKASGKQTELKMHLFDTYFTDGKDISNREVLAEAVEAIGLDRDDAISRLDSPEARDEIKTNESFWQGLGISSVPTIVFNRTSAVTGAQPVEVYKQVLTEMLAADNESQPA